MIFFSQDVYEECTSLFYLFSIEGGVKSPISGNKTFVEGNIHLVLTKEPIITHVRKICDFLKQIFLGCKPFEEKYFLQKFWPY